MNDYLLDTNVVSELRKGPRADVHVTSWFRQRHRRELFISAITLAELRRGIALIARRDQVQGDNLRVWCDRLQRDFGRTGCLLPIRAAEAVALGDLMAQRPLPVLDGFLAATAQCHSLTLATRNEADFTGSSVPVENPFAEQPNR
ncbi:MAG TPA: type II toxin-antitoxin system VapC family toxin [Chthoniobacter sp.]